MPNILIINFFFPTCRQWVVALKISPLRFYCQYSSKTVLASDPNKIIYNPLDYACVLSQSNQDTLYHIKKTKTEQINFCFFSNRSEMNGSTFKWIFNIDWDNETDLKVDLKNYIYSLNVQKFPPGSPYWTKVFLSHISQCHS